MLLAHVAQGVVVLGQAPLLGEVPVAAGPLRPPEHAPELLDRAERAVGALAAPFSFAGFAWQLGAELLRGASVDRAS
eukprot:4735356-Pyramimonas_sp.AAC.1